ncbi:diaminobutyrate--2-oxoglutarate aminotransferase [Rheinheimera sp. A13L]|uniref:diaminobutyrate--2-oxoglutarate transaminase n=1 Tax=Rheinheimera sp. A13L TaxID=506534 RepID=UPI00021248F1|nr:diaminobutyrate--2-oxoglutarate transaminase [Rheinheimera sp. A13L]EGM76585.1 diaminobutyrate--2-oxoglutarate aminotransferase [Rheinheimera sp. A13L]
MQNINLFERQESRVRSYCRTFPVVFSKSKDSQLFDENDKSYIDFLSGAGALNYGHNNDVIKNAVLEYLESDGILMSLDLHTKAKRDFLHVFQNNILNPRDLHYKIQFTSPTGTSVIESAVKLARKFTKRENIICFTNAFHGMTGVSLSLTGSNHHRQNHAYSQVSRFPFEGYLGNETDSIAYYRKLLTDPSSGIDLPAAVIVETIQAEGGLNVASVKWLQELRKMTEELGILLIIDDIQAGCGRSGAFFSFERASIKPDLVCLSKSIGGIGMPFAILLIDDKLDIWSPAEDNGTFRGNNLAFVAATSMINHYWGDTKFEVRLKEFSEYITQRLDNIVHKYPLLLVQRKGIGFMQGMQFREPAVAEYVVNQCFAAGLVIERCGPIDEVLKLMPALTISKELLDRGIDIVESTLKKLVIQTPSQIEIADC